MARGGRRLGDNESAPTNDEAIVASLPPLNGNGPVKAYRHRGEKRRNIPPAAIAAEGRVPTAPKLNYSYSPRLDPALRFDQTGAADKLPPMLEKAKHGPLTSAEVRLLAEGLRKQDPCLEWSGRRETTGFSVDPVALHIHERVSAQAILKVAARKDVTRDLFADPQLDYHQAVQFYRHEMDWSNRLILGDSLQVMASLAQREDLAGKVQMIYVDPPYGIKFASNFQPKITSKDVSEKEQDLTREPEMVRAYRDTWNLGIHSYLSYLRDRITVARLLLNDRGSVFVQISDENLHYMRSILDEVFGRRNFVCQIQVQKTGTQTGEFLVQNSDFLLWFARDKELASSKYRQLFLPRPEEKLRSGNAGDERGWAPDPMTSDGFRETTTVEFEFCGRVFHPGPNRHWGVEVAGLRRAANADRIVALKDQIRFRKYHDDFPVTPLGPSWDDVGGATDKKYVVQTAPKVIQRCMLMTTDPGDLVLDPTCGSGTTAFIAEQWGRRWITIDTSRVAISIARQRLLTAKFEYYELKNDVRGIAGGFRYKTAPHITLKSISQNTNLDAIFAKHATAIDIALETCNSALGDVPLGVKKKLIAKLLEKQRKEGKRAVTDSDRRRWLLPPDNRAKDSKLTVDAKFLGWYHWEVPFETDPDWPKLLQDLVVRYRAAWRSRMDEINACIQSNVEREELVDQPDGRQGVVRVSGPFTVEAVQPQELSLDEDASPIGGTPEADETTFAMNGSGLPTPATSGADNREADAKNADSYIDTMIRLLRLDGVRFPDNKEMRFSRLDPMGARSAAIQADGRWTPKGEVDPDPEGRATICVAFGPQYGPVTAPQVETLLRAASRRGYDDLLVAGFAFDGPAQTVIEEAENPNVRIHMVHVRPDVNPAMNGLLKETPGSQLFSVFGRPRTVLRGPAPDGSFTVEMQGVDIYDPVTNTIDPNRADKVAAWFVDNDYDGRTFCVSQAFFPDASAWEKLAVALKGVVDEEAFEALAGTVSLPFPVGEHKAVAVKVIDPRGNEVVRVHRLD